MRMMRELFMNSDRIIEFPTGCTYAPVKTVLTKNIIFRWFFSRFFINQSAII